MSDHHANPDRLKQLRIRHRPTDREPGCDYCFLVAEINRRDAEIANLQKNGEAMVAAAIGDMRREMIRALEGR